MPLLRSYAATPATNTERIGQPERRIERIALTGGVRVDIVQP